MTAKMLHRQKLSCREGLQDQDLYTTKSKGKSSNLSVIGHWNWFKILNPRVILHNPFFFRHAGNIHFSCNSIKTYLHNEWNNQIMKWQPNGEREKTKKKWQHYKHKKRCLYGCKVYNVATT